MAECDRSLARLHVLASPMFARARLPILSLPLEPPDRLSSVISSIRHPDYEDIRHGNWTKPEPNTLNSNPILGQAEQNRRNPNCLTNRTRIEPSSYIRSTNRTELNPNFVLGSIFISYMSVHVTLQCEFKKWTLLRFWIISIYLAQNLLYELNYTYWLICEMQ